MTREQMRIVAYFMRPQRARYAWIFIIVLLAVGLESLNVVAFLPIFYALLGSTGQAGHAGLAEPLMRLVRLLPVADPLIGAALLLFGIMLVKTALVLVREWLIAGTSGTVMYNVKNQLMAKFAAAPYEFFLETKQGSLINLTWLTPLRLGLLLLRVPQVVAELLKIVAIAAVLVIAWPAAALVLVGVGAIYNAITQAIGRRISYNVGTARLQASMEQSVILNEFLNGIRQIRAFDMQALWTRRFSEVTGRHRTLHTKDLCWMAVPQSLMEITAGLLLIGAVLFSRGHGGQSLQANLPVLGLFAVALVRLLPSMNAFGRLRMEMMGTLAEVEQVYELLTRPMRLRSDGLRDFDMLRNAIIFEGVSFAHQDRRVLLEDLSVSFKKGAVTALVGPSGSGKSTIVNLLLGFFEPGRGRIAVDGVPLPAYRLSSWRRQIGVVSQDTFIYHASVVDNILFGRSGVTREQVIRAAQIANAHEFITELPQGYDTMVGERGMKLSGGQQQRLAIARAVLGDPQILIFDEATSHLDTEAEKQVQAAIDEISKDRTVIVVAHRLSTVQRADRIVVLERGHIVEEGSHEELLSGRGRYFELVAAGQ